MPKKIKNKLLLLLLLFAMPPIFANSAFCFSSPTSPNIPAGNSSFFSTTFTKAWFKFTRVQRNLNEKISHYLNKIKKGESVKFFWFVMVLAFLYGFLHSLGPGHGKIVMISYFSGREANWIEGFFMGIGIAFVHSLSAVILVLSLKNIAAYVFGAGSSKEMAILKLISYGGITLVGFFLLAFAGKETKEKSIKETKQKRGAAPQWFLVLSVGIVPCAGVLLILFYAMAKQMFFTGIIAVLFMALGMATALSAIGAGYIAFKKEVESIGGFCEGPRAVKIFRYAGAVLLIAIGLFFFFYTLKIAV